jgi:CheY-like chemotaxis protein
MADDSRPPWHGGQLRGSTSWRAQQHAANGGSAEAAGGGPDFASYTPPTAPPLPPPPTPRILVVDDVAQIRHAMRELLELEGMEVIGEAADGTAAVRMTLSLNPDVVLLDWRMPVMDGLEATRQIAQLGLGAQVIICTAFDGPTIHDQAKAAGAFGIIAKGEHPQKIIELIEQACRLRGSRP